MNRLAHTWITFVLLATAACAQPAAPDFQPAQLRDFPRGTLTIERSGGRDSFRIWIADTAARSEQGLMWIRQLPRDYGMVFQLDAPRPLSMWMRNTYVPLDMLFFDAAGRITHIHPRAVPLSDEIIDSGGKVAGVIELLAGEAERRGIKTGDRIAVSATADQ
jgi:uncharacterized protein